MTFEEMCKARDPLYAATRPNASYRTLQTLDNLARSVKDAERQKWYRTRRDQLIREIKRRAKIAMAFPYPRP